MPRSSARLAAIGLLALTAGCAVGTPGRRAPQGEAGYAEPDSASAPTLARYRCARDSVDTPLPGRPWAAVLPFADESGFRRGIWDLELAVPRMLSSVLASQAIWNVVPFEAVTEVSGGRAPRRPAELRQLGDLLQADILIQGTLLDLDLERLHVGDPLLAGYKSYRGVAELEVLALRAEDGSTAGTAHARRETVERGLGLDLLGKPREQDYQFLNLDQMEFGSQAFRQTALGQAVAAAVEEVAGELGVALRPAGLEITAGVRPQILSVYGEEIFINLGSEHGVRRGYRFAVLPAPGDGEDEGEGEAAPIGVVVVQDVIGARVSRVRAVGSQAQIAPGDGLQPMSPDSGEPAGAGGEGAP